MAGFGGGIQEPSVTIVRHAVRLLKQEMRTRSELAATILLGDEAALKFAVYLGFHVSHDGEGEPATNRASRKRLAHYVENKQDIPIQVGQISVIPMGVHQMCIGTLGAIGAVASARARCSKAFRPRKPRTIRPKSRENNAIIAQQKATRARAAGQQQAQNQSLKNAAELGAIKTGLAANNIDVNSGSSVDLEASQRAER